MKKVMLFAVCAVMALTGCNSGQKKMNPADIQNDSLRSIIQARDNEINDMMGTLNDIQEGFSEINAAENRVTIAKDGEGADKATVIKEQIQFIAQRMKENRELIKKLQEQLKETGFKGDQMRKTIENLQAQLIQKDGELKKLRAELQAKNIHIAELDETISGLNSDVASLNTSVQNLNTEKTNLTNEKAQLQSESNKKSETISSQDKQLNTAWYVFGTKKELKQNNILNDGKVLREGFNRNYFTKIDIRVDKEIKLYSKSAKILTAHPSNSYSLSKDSNGQYVLRINDPQSFWSTSKYLVVQVR
jgi:chromosome segregation ATPase